MSDPTVALILGHFAPRYVATGVDANDLERLRGRIARWEDWCAGWSELAARHVALGEAAASLGRTLTAAEAFLRASLCYHYGKHLFAAQAEEYATAQTAMLRSYRRAAEGITPSMEHVTIPFDGAALFCYVRVPPGVVRPPVAVILPGLDACKEELHFWSDAFLARGMATVTLDGPGQGECAAALPITTQWGQVLGAVIDMLEARGDVDAARVGVVGQSLGALYAPLAAAGEPRLRACIANCGPFDFGPVLPQMPLVSQQTFQVRSHAASLAEGLAFAHRLNLREAAGRIECPLLIVFGAGDRIIPASEGERLARAAKGRVDYVVYEEGNHVCFNITYKFRPLTADWMREQLA